MDMDELDMIKSFPFGDHSLQMVHPDSLLLPLWCHQLQQHIPVQMSPWKCKTGGSSPPFWLASLTELPTFLQH